MAWILNRVYVRICRHEFDGSVFSPSALECEAVPTASILLCNKDEFIESLEESITSVVAAKRFAEERLPIGHIRLVLVDGLSANIDEIRRRFQGMVDTISVVPGGKLNGRHSCSVSENSDILITYDSDRRYDIRNTYELLRPFIDDWNEQKNGETRKSQRIVGTNHTSADELFPFNGGNSAYLRSVYLMHPFDTTISQTMRTPIWREEEFEWGYKLSQCGRVVSVAAFYEDMDPIPFIPHVRRMLNMPNTFTGGKDRMKEKETMLSALLKIVCVSILVVFVSSAIYFPPKAVTNKL